jgi:hypothetical protein
MEGPGNFLPRKLGFDKILDPELAENFDIIYVLQCYLFFMLMRLRIQTAAQIDPKFVINVSQKHPYHIRYGQIQK